MKCPQCHTKNQPGATECDSCGVVFRHLNRAESAKQAGAVVICAWNDQGRRCPSRGIISNATDGSGPWYCREHSAKLHGVPIEGVMGNSIPASRSQSLATVAWHAKMSAYKAAGGHSILDRRGNMPMPITRERQPGDDDG